MRTYGTFQDVYEQASLYRDGEPCTVMDPVVRRNGDEWSIESALTPDDGDVEVPLDNFIEYWFSGDDCTGYEPTPEEIKCWLDVIFE